MPTEQGAERRRVVIVGGGFGGLAAAKKLRRADVDVTVVDRMNHHLFQPLLYQVASGELSGGDCAAPIRGMLKRQFRRIEPHKIRVILLDAGDRVLTAFSEKLSARAARALAKLGVDVREGARVTGVDSRGVTFEIGGSTQRITARTVIWAAG